MFFVFIVWLVLAAGYIFSGKLPREYRNPVPSHTADSWGHHRDLAEDLDRAWDHESRQSLLWGILGFWRDLHSLLGSLRIVSARNASRLRSANLSSFFMVVAVPKSAQHLHWLLLEAVLA